MWALICPFKKSGFPSVGSFGARVEAVVIITVDEWKRLCADTPQLQTTQFDVGTYVDGDESRSEAP
jgi:hypothetical protein